MHARGAAGQPRLGTRMAWIWVTVGGVFILIPGFNILCFYTLWSFPWWNTGPAWAMAYGVFLVPPLLFLGVGAVTIGIGARRYRDARAS